MAAEAASSRGRNDLALLGVTIPDGYLFSVIPVTLTFLTGLLAWIVKEMGKQQSVTAAMSERINAHQETQLAQAQTLAAQATILSAQAALLAGMEARLRGMEHS